MGKVSLFEVAMVGSYACLQVYIQDLLYLWGKEGKCFSINEVLFKLSGVIWKIDELGLIDRAYLKYHPDGEHQQG